MQVLEEILEEIELEKKRLVFYPDCSSTFSAVQIRTIEKIEQIICKYMSIRNHMNDGWMPVERELPPNAKHKGTLCPRCQLDTKYGVTEGWYNPDLESWFVLIWFMTERYLDSEIDFERGAHPKIVRCENEVNEKHRIVLAWRPFPEPYRPERSNEHDGE